LANCSIFSSFGIHQNRFTFKTSHKFFQKTDSLKKGIFLFITLLLTVSSFAQVDTSKSSLKFDLGFSRSHNTNLWPIYKRVKTKDNSDLQILAPLFRNYRDAKNHENHSHVFPLFWYDSTARGRNLRLLSLYYPTLLRFSSNAKEDEKTFKFLELAPYINFFEISQSANGAIINNNLLFFILYNNNRITHRSYLICFPLFWSFKSPEKTSTTFIPFYSSGTYNNHKGKYLVVTPLFWRFSDSAGYRIFLFPIWKSSEHITNTDTTYSSVVFPLYWSKKDKSVNNKVFFPVLWDLKNEKYQSFTVAPLFSVGHSTDNERRHLAVTPLFWHIKNGTYTSNTLIPFWWNRELISYHINANGVKIADTNSATYVFPLFWSHKNENGQQTIVFPLLWGIRDREKQSLTLFPLFSMGHYNDGAKNYVAVTPFFWHFKTSYGHTNVLFPLWWNSKKMNYHDTSATNIIFPLYWSRHSWYSNYNIFFPFIWDIKTKSYHSFTFEPFFSTGKSTDGKRRHIAITPFFWHYSDSNQIKNRLFPIWWYKKDIYKNDTNITNVLFPIYWAYKGHNYNNKVLFPIIWVLNNGRYKSLTIEPLFSVGHSTDNKKKHIAITPLFWHVKDTLGYKNRLFPIWWNNKRIEYQYANGKEIVYDTNCTNVIFPLYWSYSNNHRTNKAFVPFFWEHKDSLSKSVTAIPLFAYGNSIKEKKSYLAITPLFWHIKDSDKYSNTLIPFWWSKSRVIYKWNGKRIIPVDTEHTTEVFPLYWSYHSKWESNKVFIPFLWSHKDSLSRSFTFAPFFSFGNSAKEKKSYLVATPLYWHFKDSVGYSNTFFPLWRRRMRVNYKWNGFKYVPYDTSHATEVTPLFWSYHDKTQNYKVLFPLLWSFKDSVRKSFTFAPLFSAGHSPVSKKSYLVATPLFWHFKDRTSHTNLFFPFWYNHQRIKYAMKNSKMALVDTVRATYVFPFYWSYRDMDVLRNIFFPILWSNKDKFHSSFTLFPLFSSGRSTDNKSSHLIITPLFWSLKSHGIMRTTLFPLFNTYKDTTGEKKFNVLYVAYRYTKIADSVSVNFLWPIVEYTHAKALRYFRITPIVWYKKSPKVNYFTVQPFYYHGKDTAGESTHIFWELFVHKRQFNKMKSTRFLWRTVVANRYDNGDHEFRILQFVYVNAKKDSTTEHGIFPFYHKVVQKNGDMSFSTMMGFYHHIRRQVPDTKEYYEEVKVLWFIRLLSNAKALKAKGIDMKQKKLI